LLMPESGHFRVEHKQSSELQTVLAEEAICSELRKLQLTRKNTGNFCSAESGSQKSISAGKYQREKVRIFPGVDGKNENGPGEGPAFANKIENGFECFL
jgi:hypothetical protein